MELNECVKRTILVIDDEKGLRDMFAHTLGERGFGVETAACGEEGVMKAKTQTFDVVLCDIMMPGMGGIMALEILKEVQPNTEVIMITGFANEGSAKACKLMGAFDYISKPCELDPLCDLIGKAIERKSIAKSAVPAAVLA